MSVFRGFIAMHRLVDRTLVWRRALRCLHNLQTVFDNRLDGLDESTRVYVRLTGRSPWRSFCRTILRWPSKLRLLS